MTVTTVRTPPVLRAGAPGGSYHAVDHGPQGLAPLTRCGRLVRDDWTVFTARTPVTCDDCLRIR